MAGAAHTGDAEGTSTVPTGKYVFDCLISAVQGGRPSWKSGRSLTGLSLPKRMRLPRRESSRLGRRNEKVGILTVDS